MKTFGVLLVLFLSVVLISAQEGAESAGGGSGDISQAKEIFYGAMLTGGSTCDVNKSMNTILLPNYLQGSGRAEVYSGAGYLGAISAMISSLEEKAKATPPLLTSDVLASLIPKAVVNILKMKFQSECSTQNQSSSDAGSQGRKRQACATLFDNFVSWDASLEAQSRNYIQQYGTASQFGLRENPTDFAPPVAPGETPASPSFDPEINLWGLVVDKLLGLLGGDMINPSLTSYWKTLVKNWFTSSEGLDLERLAMWAFATDDVSDEWDAALSASYESLSVRGQIFFAFYLKNRNVNVGLSGATLARERIDLFQNVLKLAMDRIRIDHFGNTAFVTVADFLDGPERPDWTATSMLLIHITKFGIPFDLKPTKMANFLASFGRQGDLEFPIEQFKSFNSSKEIAWALVALAIRQVTVRVDLDLKVVADSQDILSHKFQSCCDAHVKTSFNRWQELSGGKTVAFDACGSGDISVTLRFIRDTSQGGSGGNGGGSGGNEGGSGGSGQGQGQTKGGQSN